MEKCKKHPKYKGKGLPRCNCTACWKIYLQVRIERLKERNRLLQQELDFHFLALARVEQLLKEAHKIIERKLKEN